jgi:hypothetical protein
MPTASSPFPRATGARCASPGVRCRGPLWPSGPRRSSASPYRRTRARIRLRAGSRARPPRGPEPAISACSCAVWRACSLPLQRDDQDARKPAIKLPARQSGPNTGISSKPIQIRHPSGPRFLRGLPAINSAEASPIQGQYSLSQSRGIKTFSEQMLHGNEFEVYWTLKSFRPLSMPQVAHFVYSLR